MTTPPSKNSGLAGALICGLVAGVLFLGYFRDDQLKHPLLLLAAACLFAIPAILGLLELLFREAMEKARPRLGGLVLGLWFCIFGSVLTYGGLSPDSKLRGGIPFLPEAWNRAMGQMAFTVTGLLLIGLGIVIGLHRRS